MPTRYLAGSLAVAALCFVAVVIILLRGSPAPERGAAGVDPAPVPRQVGRAPGPIPEQPGEVPVIEILPEPPRRDWQKAEAKPEQATDTSRIDRAYRTGDRYQVQVDVAVNLTTRLVAIPEGQPRPRPEQYTWERKATFTERIGDAEDGVVYRSVRSYARGVMRESHRTRTVTLDGVEIAMDGLSPISTPVDVSQLEQDFLAGVPVDGFPENVRRAILVPGTVTVGREWQIDTGRVAEILREILPEGFELKAERGRGRVTSLTASSARITFEGQYALVQAPGVVNLREGSLRFTGHLQAPHGDRPGNLVFSLSAFVRAEGGDPPVDLSGTLRLGEQKTLLGG